MNHIVFFDDPIDTGGGVVRYPVLYIRHLGHEPFDTASSLAEGEEPNAQAMSVLGVDPWAPTYAAELAGIDGKPRIVIEKERRVSLVDLFLDDLFSRMANHLNNAIEQKDFRLR